MTHSDRFIPELLAPAGSLEKLKVATLYGAHAVYLGGQSFGLRSAAENFTSVELREGVEFAHARGTKVFVVLNSFLHDHDLENLVDFICELEQLKVDAVIVSDLGVIETIKKYTNLEIHLSTQASCLNIASAMLWKKMGVKRVVLGREVSIADAKKIKQATGLEVELFIHGSMCMAYSGNCVISNYTQGRDSNRGGCAHSCRFEYQLDFKNPDIAAKNSYFMSSKDLMGIRLLQDFIDAEIDSLKVEGRMKSHHYAGTVSQVYSEALNFYRKHGHFLSDDLERWENELRKVSHRDYTEGSLIEEAGSDSIYHEREGVIQDFQVIGVVSQTLKDQCILLEVRSPFTQKCEVEIVPFSGGPIHVAELEFSTFNGERPSKSRPGTLVKIPYYPEVEPFNLVRARVES